ncbi:MAG: peptide deformylase [Pseudomonadota bacterium]
MSRPFLIWPDARLRQAAAPVGPIDDGVHAVWAEMIAAMCAMPGLGLAAPQIGEMRALAIVDATGTGREVIRMADPALISASVETEMGAEASPNLPGVSAQILRPKSIRLAFTNPQGAREERDLTGLWARSALHQLDHLAGKLFVERLSATRRRMLLAKWHKQQRRAG